MFVLMISRSGLKLITWGKKLGPWPNQRKPCKDSSGHIFQAIIMNLAQIVVMMISWSSLKLGHLGSKIGHQAKSAENLVNTLAITFFKQSS